MQLPVNAPKIPVRTNQQRGQMDFRKPEEIAKNPHINYEPSMNGGYEELRVTGIPHQPKYEAEMMSMPIDRTNNYGQAGETYRSFEDWERDELIKNLSDALAVCNEKIQRAMIEHFTKADEDYGKRVQEGITQKMKELENKEAEVPGRLSGETKFGQGSLAANEARKEAVNKSREADAY